MMCACDRHIARLRDANDDIALARTLTMLRRGSDRQADQHQERKKEGTHSQLLSTFTNVKCWQCSS
jgi:hypothetical protein